VDGSRLFNSKDPSIDSAGDLYIVAPVAWLIIWTSTLFPSISSSKTSKLPLRKIKRHAEVDVGQNFKPGIYSASARFVVRIAKMYTQKWKNDSSNGDDDD
jgi:hypothetical protein